MIDENKIEKLERKIKELEKKIENQPKQEERIKEVQSRLAGYQDVIRSDKGEIYLKKNLVIQNRKGDIPRHEGKNDNSFAIYFNDQDKDRLNHIFLGTNSVKGFNNNSVIQGIVRKRDDAPNIPNNGSVQFVLFREKDITSEGTLVSTKVPQISLQPLEILNLSAYPDLDNTGDYVSLYSENGMIGFGRGFNFIYLNNNGLQFKNLISKKSFLPTSNPGVEGVVWNDNGTLKISSG